MARRLVEAGVRMVTLTYGGWDMHNDITRGMKRQMPALDQALATLILDLDQRGLAGADAGDGLQRIRPHAQDQPERRTRPLAEGVQRDAGRRRHQGRHDLRHVQRHGLRTGIDPVSPADLATTMYHQLGIVADKELMAPGDRPIEIVDGGKVVKPLMA